jgi:acyl transferase domain-containing protein
MAAVSAPIDEVERIIAEVDGYVVLANVNSGSQLLLGGATAAVERAIALLVEAGHRAMRLPVSHAFHTSIVAPASEPLRAMLRRLELSPQKIPVVANVDGEFYPSGPGVEDQIVEILGRQVASPVQFVKGLQTLYDAGARVLVETGPKRALWGFAADVLRDDVMNLFTNHPKVGELPSFNQALCGLWAAGVGAIATEPAVPVDEPVVISGAAVGTPGTEKVFDDGNLSRLLHGEQFIDVIPRGRAARSPSANHAPRQVRGRLGHVPDDRRSRRRDQAGRPRRGDRRGRGVRPRRGPRRRARAPDAVGDRGRHSTRCATPGSRSSSTTRTRRAGPSCPTTGGCRTPCATTPG